MTLRVDLTFEQVSTNNPSVSNFKLWTDVTLKKLSPSITAAYTSVSIVIVNEEKITELNQQFRNKTGPTNVLSFDFANGKHHIPDYLGDLILCDSVIMKEASEQKKIPLHHWAHITIHGLLHLFGYDHLNDQQAHVMESLEIAILEDLGYANPYTPRT